MSYPAIGSPAPDFSLPSTSGITVSLSALRGRPVLLAFFPLAFTSTCTTEVCAFSEDYGRFQELGAEVLPISVDAVPSLKVFKAQEGLTTDLLSDFKREASRAYGVLLEDRFHSARAYFLIDAAGVLRWSHIETRPGELRQNDELLRQIRAIL